MMIYVALWSMLHRLDRVDGFSVRFGVSFSAFPRFLLGLAVFRVLRVIEVGAVSEEES